MNRIEGSSDSKSGTSQPMTRLVGAMKLLPSLIRQVGGDPESIFRDAGLDPTVLAAPGNRISYDSLLRTMQLTAERTGCPHFGLIVGQSWQLADLGLLGEIMRNSPRVESALQQLVLHQHINSDGTLAFMVQRGATVDLGYAAYADFPASMLHMYDAVMAAATNFMRELCGPNWNPASVLLQHSSPDDVAPYHRFFKAPVYFDSDICALRFHSSWLEQPLRGADETALLAAEARAIAAGRPAFSDSARRSLRTLLIYGRTSGADLALSLAVHRRTLDRMLAVEGTTFQQVLDEVRLSVARELLLQSRLAILEIAPALGFKDQVAFFRAFRRWTGTTPGAWRDSMRTTEPPATSPEATPAD
jgi:AraC-like DNA-binding protein